VAAGIDTYGSVGGVANAPGSILTPAAFFGTCHIDHNGRTLPFGDLEASVGVISMGLRADTSGAHRVEMDSRHADILAGNGLEQLYRDLVTRNVIPRPVALSADIFQTDNPNRSIVELSSNSLDAGSRDIDIQLEEGSYVVTDTGSGMDARAIVVKLLLPKLSGKIGESKKVGRFGIGFYTALRHLKADGDFLELESCPRGGGDAHRLIFKYLAGKIGFYSEQIAVEAGDAISEGGTRVRVNAGDIEVSAIEAEISKYLRLVNDGRRVLVNGRMINSFNYSLYDALNAEGDLGRVYLGQQGPSLVTIKVGEIIIESRAIGGDIVDGELVIELPHTSGLSITRDAIAIDKKIYDYLRRLVARVQNIREANSLASLLESLDRRHEFEPLRNLLRDRVTNILKSSDIGAPIYPDIPSLREKLAPGTRGFFVHPSLYNPEWLERFAVPDEFLGGVVFSAGGWERPLRLVLTGDLQSSMHLDKAMGVLYINEDIYRARPAFVFSALALVPGMDFRMRWSHAERAISGGMRTSGMGDTGIPDARQRETPNKKEVSPIPGSDVIAIMRELKPLGYDLNDFQLRIGVTTAIEKAGGRAWIKVQDNGREKLYDAEGRPVYYHGTKKQIEGDRVEIYEAGGRAWIRVKDNDIEKLYDAEGRPVYYPDTDRQIEEDGVDVFDVGGRMWIKVQDGDIEKLYDIEGRPVYYSETKRQIEGDEIYISEAGGRAWIKVQDGGREKLYDAEGRPIYYHGTEKQIEGDEIYIYEAGGRTWIWVKDDGRWKLYDAEGRSVYYHGTEKQIEGDLIIISEAGGRVWIRVKDDGKEKSYDAEGRPVYCHGTERQIEGDRVEIYKAGGRAWINVLEGGKYKLYDIEGRPVYYHGTDRQIEEDSIYISEVGGRAWIQAKDVWRSRLYDAEGRPVYYHGTKKQIDGNRVEIYEAGGRTWIEVQNGDIEKLYDSDGRYIPGITYIKETPSGVLALTEDGFIRLHDLEKILTDSAIKKRFEELRSHRIYAPSVKYALFNADEAVWRQFLDNPQIRRRLSLIRTREALAYAAAYPQEDAERLENALVLIDKIPPQGLDENIYLQRIATVMRSGMDISEIIKDLSSGRDTQDILALREYLRVKDSVGPGKVQIAKPEGEAKSLADVVTHLRLYGRKSGIDGATRAAQYGSEEDRRLVNHAIHHLHAIHPHVYLRELLQNSLDVQSVPGRVADEQHRIEAETFIDGDELVLRMRDYGGMTEDEVTGLILPGEGSKGSGDSRGGFGIGFYAAMAGARWVRMKTAQAGADYFITLNFEVKRNYDGEIIDILLTTKKEENRDNFTGTIVETARHSDVPLLAAAHIQTRLRNMGQYISRHEAEMVVNGTTVNASRNGALITVEDDEIGRVELYDGLENAILLGGLPLTDLPDEVWQGVPEGIRDYYARKGFYINLDHRHLLPTPTRDRLREQTMVMNRLRDILPGMLLKGFLTRVMSVEHPEDLLELPEVYFIDSYGMASKRNLGRQMIADARLINSGRYAEVNMSPYADPQNGRTKLVALLTMVKFIKVEGIDEHLSLREVHDTWIRACKGDLTARSRLELILVSETLPPSIRDRLMYAGSSRATGETNQRLVETLAATGSNVVRDFQAGIIYDLEEIQDPAYERYLHFLQEMTMAIYGQFGGRNVTVGINTRRDHSSAFALHWAADANYYLYLSFGSWLNKDVTSLEELRSNPDRAAARTRFDRFLAGMYEVVTHELTHVLREHRDVITHTGRFYADQMDLMLTPTFTQGQIDNWFSSIRD
jgi:hypothetical protein